MSVWALTAEHAALYWALAWAWAPRGCRPPTAPLLRVLCNLWLVTPTFLCAWEGLFAHDTPPAWHALPQACGAAVVASVSFYALHRLCHTAWLYRQVHRWHHRTRTVEAWAAFDAHPVEHVVLNLLPVFLAAACVGWPRAWVRVWAHVCTANSLWAHSAPDAFHGLHHRLGSVNFGAAPWCDRLCGTLVTKRA